jgi:DNA-binding Lrp family transcriptional regulator
MRRELTTFEKRLCNALQNGLPVCRRPYAEVAKQLGVDEQKVLEGTRRLAKRGVIRRIGAVINWRAIGKASTLVTACVPERKMKKVVEAVNELEGVSHNYLRKHRYNLWWTLRANSQREITAVLKKLSKQFSVEFYSLPAQRIFKLDVRFNAQSGGRRLLGVSGTGPLPKACRGRQAEMDEADRRILAGLQEGLEVVERPYNFLCKDDLSISEVLTRLATMLEKGVIYRIGAVVNHHKLGFVANAMFVCKVGGARVIETGQKLAELNIVSHCYQRKTFAGWPFNIFAMMHGRSQADIRRVVDRFVREEKIRSFEVLATVEKLRK